VTDSTDDPDLVLLGELLAGDRAETDAEVAAMLQRRKDLHGEWQRLRGLCERLERTGHELSAELAEAQAGVTADDIATARRMVQLGRRRWRQPWWLSLAGAAAAACLIVALCHVPRPAPQPEPPDPHLGATSPEIEMTTRDGADGSPEFSWQRKDGAPLRQRGETLKIVIWPMRDGAPVRDGKPLFTWDQIEADSWAPSLDEARQLKAAGPTWIEVRIVGERERTVQQAPLRIGAAAPRRAPPASPIEPSQLRDLLVALATAPRGAELQARQDEMRARCRVSAGTAWQREKTVVLAAIAAGREAARDRPYPDRAVYECWVAAVLELMGLRDCALDTLAACFGTPPPADPDPMRDREAKHWFAKGANDLAQFQHAAGQFDAAVATAQRTQALTRGVLLHDHIDALCTEARVRIDLGTLNEARERLDDALDRQKELEQRLAADGRQVDEQTYAFVCLVDAEYRLALDQPRAARRALQRYRDHYPPHNNADFAVALDVTQAIASLAEAETAGEPDADAEAALRQLLADELVGRHARGARVMLLRAALLRGDLAAAQRELDALRQQASPDGGTTHWRGAAQLETLTTRLLLRQGADRERLGAQFESHRGAFDALVREMSGMSVRPDGVGYLAAASRRQVLTELIRLQQRLDPAAAPALAFELLATIEGLTTLTRELQVPRATLAQVQATYAGPRACVLAFLAEPNGSFALAIDADGVHLFDLPGTAATEPHLRELGAGLLQAIDDAAPADTGTHVMALARSARDAVLTADLRAYLEHFDTVTIADHGMLGRLPWEALAWSDDTLFGERFAVNSMTSLPAGVELRRSRWRTAGADGARLQLVATLRGAQELTHGDGGAAQRDLQPAELAPLLEAFGRSRATALANADATCDAAQQSLAGATIAHFLCHGGRRGRGAQGLALVPAAGGDGLLAPADAATWTAPAVVLLTACTVGSANPRVGDDPLCGTLGGAFVLAGAHTVVQSASDLRLGTQLRFYATVYPQLAAGASVAAALRAARAAIDRSDLRARFECAQVQAFGLGHLPVAR